MFTVDGGAVVAYDAADGVTERQNGAVLLLQRLVFQIPHQILNEGVDPDGVESLTRDDSEDLGHQLSHVLFAVVAINSEINHFGLLLLLLLLLLDFL